MDPKAKHARDAFDFSLGGLSTKCSFVLIPAIDNNRIPREASETPERPRENLSETDGEMPSFWGRLWLRALRRAA